MYYQLYGYCYTCIVSLFLINMQSCKIFSVVPFHITTHTRPEGAGLIVYNENARALTLLHSKQKVGKSWSDYLVDQIT